MARLALASLGLLLISACRPGTSSATHSKSDLAASAAGTSDESSHIRLSSVTNECGVKFAFHDGREARVYSMLESLGGGLAGIDFDRDGAMDLCTAGGGGFVDQNTIHGLPIGLFRNLGNWRFVAVRESAGLDGRSHYNHGIVVGDYDVDGFSDLLVTGYGGVQLWRNLGDGTFLETHESAGLADTSWSSSAAWGDFNQDGCPDVYIAHYVNWSFTNHPYCRGPGPGERDICPPRDFSPLPHVIYYSNGDGVFRDATSEAGLQPGGKGLGVLSADFDVDGDVDIYVANDTTENFLYVNDGHGHFQEVGLFCGVAVDDSGTPNGSMGVDLCDFNRDGLPEIWVTNYEREAFALYRNEGQGQFLHVSQSTGITALQGLFVGFGTACTDIDRDGDEDILVTNGHVILYPQASPRRQLPVLLENQDLRFRRVMNLTDRFFTTPHEGRGLTAVDFDNDGDADFAISHLNDPVELLRNDSVGGNWLALELIGTNSNRDAVGARIVVRTPMGDWHRQMKGGGSYLSTLDSRVFFGLGNADKIDEVTVIWPSGQSTTLVSPNLNEFHTLVEPRPQPRVPDDFQRDQS